MYLIIRFQCGSGGRASANKHAHESDLVKGETMASVGFMQVGPRGICFAHGPYLNQCPQWPTCGEAPKQQRYIDLGKRPSSEWFEFPFNSVIRAEHERLKQAVVEATKLYVEINERGDVENILRTAKHTTRCGMRLSHSTSTKQK